MASADKTVHCWDLGSNQKMQVAQHDAPVKTVHWIKAPTYSCIMTGSWDKTLKVCMGHFSYLTSCVITQLNATQQITYTVDPPCMHSLFTFLIFI